MADPPLSENEFGFAENGDYRIIYLDDDVLIVAIERVRHRPKVYR